MSADCLESGGATIARAVRTRATLQTPCKRSTMTWPSSVAGHNGLTCACYLARAGLKVGVFERRGIAGGAAVTEEFHPGFRNSTASYTVSLLHQQVIRDLRLQEHGLRIIERPMQNFLPLGAGPRQFLRRADQRANPRGARGIFGEGC